MTELAMKRQAVYPMNPVLREIGHNPMLWLPVFTPGPFVAAHLWPAAHTLLFVLSVLAIVPPGDAAETRH